MKTDDEIDSIMNAVPIQWRWHWCTVRECGCMGCVQVGLKDKTLTYEEWLNWNKRHPKPLTPDDSIIIYIFD